MSYVGTSTAVLAGILSVALTPPGNASKGSSSDPAGPSSLAEPTRVVLDYKNQPFEAVVRSIAQRSSKRVEERIGVTNGAFQPRDPGAWGRKVTLLSPEPVPFWEAIDRLAEAASSGYHLTSFNESGLQSTGVVFSAGTPPPGPANYAGPFRVGLAGVHAHHELLFVRAPWVNTRQTGFAAPIMTDQLGEMPPDGGPLYVELRLLAEPGLIAHRAGLLADLEATDETGRSLLAPLPEAGRSARVVHSRLQAESSQPLLVPLERKDSSHRQIQRLRGVIPVEIARVKPQPALVIRLAGSEGKTFHAGGVEIVVKTANLDPGGGPYRIELTGQVEGDGDAAVRSARADVFLSSQFRLVDGRGVPVRAGSSSTGCDFQGHFHMSFFYSPGLDASKPAELRIHDLDRMRWAVPFEFRDIPLP